MDLKPAPALASWLGEMSSEVKQNQACWRIILWDEFQGDLVALCHLSEKFVWLLSQLPLD